MCNTIKNNTRRTTLTIVITVLILFSTGGCFADKATTSNGKYGASFKKFPVLETETFMAYIADNTALGVHRAGYNGVASLIPKNTGNNLFVPLYGGFNYEAIYLNGFTWPERSFLEPRLEPMYIESYDDKSVTLIQPETSSTHVSAKIVFTVEEPYYLHQHIELTFHKRLCKPDEKNTFKSLWANYMNAVPDRHMYFKANLDSDELSDWFGATRDDTTAAFQVRPLPSDREITVADHLAIMNSEKPLTDEQLASMGLPEGQLPRDVDGPLSFYYGLSYDTSMMLIMFKQPERFRYQHNPKGGGPSQFCSNPAWDYYLYLEDAEIGKAYSWDLCAVIKPFKGRKDVLNEVKKYLSK